MSAVWAFARRHPIALAVGLFLMLTPIVRVLRQAPWEPPPPSTSTLAVPMDEALVAVVCAALLVLVGAWVIGYYVLKDRRHRRLSAELERLSPEDRQRLDARDRLQA